MLSVILNISIACLIAYLAASTIYLLILVFAYFLVPEPATKEDEKYNRFAILVPAHNEEMLISRLCQSLLEIQYQQEFYEIFIIADNCTDKTAELSASYAANVMVRKSADNFGKGFALDFAIRHIPIETFDAILIIDADNIVDSLILAELNKSINQGEQAIQCCNGVGNRSDSSFTELLYVSRLIGNHLYHHAKYKLGLSSYLMGNGICFTRTLLKNRGWTAFTAGEDWEYYAQLASDGIKIGFAIGAKIFHQESRSLNQATSQRLRWASGKFHVLRKYGLRLLWKGVREKNMHIIDASLPLIFPNYSLQLNMTIFAIGATLIIPETSFKGFFIAILLVLLGCQLSLFIVGSYLAGKYCKIFKAIMFAPVFLVWKAIIDIFSITGIYKPKKWIRTKRHKPT